MINQSYGLDLNTAHSLSDQIKGNLDSISNSLIKVVNIEIYKTNKIIDILNISSFYTKVVLIFNAIIYIPIILNLDFVLNLWLGYLPKYLYSIVLLVLIRGLLFQFITFFPSIFNNLGKIYYFNILESILYIFIGISSVYFYNNNISPYSFYYIMIIGVFVMFLIRFLY